MQLHTFVAEEVADVVARARNKTRVEAAVEAVWDSYRGSNLSSPR